jgi:signal transduction histidine kinase
MEESGGDESALRSARAEIEAVTAELRRSREQFDSYAGTLSHDLKAPLVAVAGYVEMLRHLTAVDQQPAEYDELLGEVLDGVEAMRTLIDRHLELATAHGAPLTRVRVDLTATVESVLAPHVRHRHHAGAPVPVVTCDPLPPVLGDAAMLRQVVDNLLGNAIKYTEPGTAARIEITGRPDPDGTVLIEIADRGIGVPDGQHELIFTRFHRAHGDGYPGTGLGLSICAGIVRRHGGEIGCRPHPGGGTRFWLTLPGAGAAGRQPDGELTATAVPAGSEPRV